MIFFFKYMRRVVACYRQGIEIPIQNCLEEFSTVNILIKFESLNDFVGFLFCSLFPIKRELHFPEGLISIYYNN